MVTHTDLLDRINEIWYELVRPRDSRFNGQTGRWEHTLPLDHLWYSFPEGTDMSQILVEKAKIWLPVSNPTIVPGGEFEEVYPWDMYPTIRGLYTSHNEAIRALPIGIAENIFYSIDTFGFIPNTNMVPYLTRSQPPVLASIIQVVYNKHNWKSDEEKKVWLENAVAALEKEYDFWMTRRVDESTGLNVYRDDLFDDKQRDTMLKILVNKFNVDGSDTRWLRAARSEKGTSLEATFEKLLQQDDIYQSRYVNDRIGNIPLEDKIVITHRRAACESGWDYSTRWLVDSNFPHGRANDIIPVDLNSMLAFYEGFLVDAYKNEFDDKQKSNEWRDRLKRRTGLMNNFLLNPEDNIFYDFDTKRSVGGKNSERTKFRSLASYFPLWAGIATHEQAESMKDSLHEFMEPYGLKTTLDVESKMQWDGLNGWAILHMFVADGLFRYGFEDEAREIMGRWVSGIQSFYRKHDHFPERINVRNPLHTTNGRYDAQTGFGWTNGATAYFIKSLDNMS